MPVIKCSSCGAHFADNENEWRLDGAKFLHVHPSPHGATRHEGIPDRPGWEYELRHALGDLREANHLLELRNRELESLLAKDPVSSRMEEIRKDNEELLDLVLQDLVWAGRAYGGDYGDHRCRYCDVQSPKECFSIEDARHSERCVLAKALRIREKSHQRWFHNKYPDKDHGVLGRTRCRFCKGGELEGHA